MAFKMDMLLTLMLVSVPMQFARAMTWSSCAESPFSPSKVTLKPDPPVSGQDVTFTISGDYVPQEAKTIPQGVLNVAVQFMGTPIFETTWDLCAKTECPITPGALEVVYKQTLPPIAPPGQYQVRLEAQDADAETLFCMNVDFRIKPPSLRRIADSIRQSGQ